GSNTSSDADGTMTLTRTIDSATGTCRVHVSFTSILIKMNEIHDEVAKRVVARGHQPDRVTIKGFAPTSAFLIHDIQINGIGNMTTSWSGDLAIDKKPVASFQGTTLD